MELKKLLFAVLYFIYGLSFLRFSVEMLLSFLLNPNILSLIQVPFYYYLSEFLLGVISFIISIMLFIRNSNFKILKALNYAFIILILIDLVLKKPLNLFSCFNQITSLVLATFFIFFNLRLRERHARVQNKKLAKIHEQKI